MPVSRAEESLPAPGAPIGDRATLWIAAALLAAYGVLAVAQMGRVGEATDEGHYLRSGRAILSGGWDLPITRLHGPLLYVFSQTWIDEFPSYELGESAPKELLFRARLGLLPFGLLTGAVVFLWARRAFGNVAGLLALSAYALNPLMLGYGGVLSSDAVHAACWLTCLWLLWLFLERPSRGRGLALGIGLGLALATKYLALLIAPFVVVLAALGAARAAEPAPAPVPVSGGPWRRILRGTLAGAALALVALATLHACYGFQGGFASTDPALYEAQRIRDVLGWPVVGRALGVLPRPFLLGVDFQMRLTDADAPAGLVYLNGRYVPNPRGFYLWGIVLKTPEWCLFALLGVALFRAPRWILGAGSASERRTAGILLLALLVLVGYLSLFPRIRAGVRYVLPAFPMLFVLVGAAAGGAWVRALPRAALCAAGAALLALQAMELRANWPSLTGYYSTLAGGPSASYRHFANSNSGWVREGETLAELRRIEPRPFEVLAPADGPRFGLLAVPLRALVQPDPEDPTRARHWLQAFEAERYVAGWWLFDATPAAFEEAARHGADERVRADLALAYLGAGRLEDARRIIGQLGAERARRLEELIAGLQAVERPDASLEALTRVVELWSAFGRSDRVVELLERHPSPALASHPARPLWLAQALARQDRREAAIAVLEGVPDPRGPLAAYLLSLYRLEMRHAEALELYRRIAAESGADAAELERMEQEIQRMLEFERRSQ